MAFQQSFLDEIRTRVPLTQLVSRRVQLRQKSRDDWWGLSPFTIEKSPSFHVRDDKGFYHCFSTGEHGDHFSWLMQVEGLSFPEAVETVAGLAGMEVPRSSPQERHREERGKDIRDVIAFAMRWYVDRLQGREGQAAKAYLQERALTLQTMETFDLGFAPNDRDSLALAAKEQGINMAQLLEAGLYRQPDEGRAPYPLFRNRIMFPIQDRRGRTIAFGGRFMGDSRAAGVGKYINSPDTPLFDKSRTLYNIHRVRDTARAHERLVVVEGYMDVIALYQNGFPFAVAPLGTAVTESQIAELWRHVDEPTFCLDGDVAGYKAAIRAAERALPNLSPGKSLSFAFLPEGEDPDSLVRAGDGKKSFGKTISDAQPLAKFLFDAGSDGLRLDTPERRARLEAELLRHCETIQNGIVRKEYQRTFRDMLWQLHHKKRQSRLKQTRREAIREYRFQRDLVRGPQAEQPFGRKLMETASRRLVRRRQEIVLATLINHPALISDYDEALDEIVFDPDLDKLRAELQNQLLSGDMLDPEALKHHLFSRGVESIYSAVTSQGVYSLAPQAKPTADLHAARSLLDHILLIRQQASLEREYLAEGVRIDDGNTEGETGKLKNDAGSKKPARVKRLEELRRLMEDVEGRLGPDISEYGDS